VLRGQINGLLTKATVHDILADIDRLPDIHPSQPNRVLQSPPSPLSRLKTPITRSGENQPFSLPERRRRRRRPQRHTPNRIKQLQLHPALIAVKPSMSNHNRQPEAETHNLHPFLARPNRNAHTPEPSWQSPEIEGCPGTTAAASRSWKSQHRHRRYSRDHVDFSLLAHAPVCALSGLGVRKP